MTISVTGTSMCPAATPSIADSIWARAPARASASGPSSAVANVATIRPHGATTS